MEQEDDKFLQSAVSSFTKARRIRWLQVVGLCLLVFATGVLVGMSIKYEAVEITIETPRVKSPEGFGKPKTTRT